MSKKIAVLILLFTFLPVINAQNPSADWVMLFKYRILIEAISKDGSGFVAVTKSEEGKNTSVIIHLISSERKMIFKKTISFDEDLFEAEKNTEPCFRDEKNMLDYECLRIVNAFTGKLKV